MMKILQNLKFILLALAILLILVVVRNSDRNVFRNDAENAIETIKKNNHILSQDQLLQLKTPWLVVNLGSNDLSDSIHIENSIRIPLSNLLDEVNRKILSEVKGDLILYSADLATASKAWIILNQLGFKNVKILSAEEIQEELKYKFQPDTTARLELDSM